MATRFYYARTPTAPISPAIDAGWNNSTNLGRFTLFTTHRTVSFADNTPASPGSGNNNQINAQFISDPLAAQTISGYFKGIGGANQSNADVNAHAQVLVKVVSLMGTGVRGTLVPLNNTSSVADAFNVGSNLTRRYPHTNLWSGTNGVAIGPLDIAAGDRIVIEYGARTHRTVGTARTISYNYGDSTSGTDANDTGGQTPGTGAIPWFEFSQDLTFLGTEGIYLATLAAVEEVYEPVPPSLRGTLVAVEMVYSPQSPRVQAWWTD